MDIKAQIGKMLATLTENAGTEEGKAVLRGFLKLLARFGVGRRNVREIRAALILTQAEEGALLGLGLRSAKWVVRIGAKVFVLTAFAELVWTVIVGEGVRRTFEERVEIATAHILKGPVGPMTLFAVGEQALFAVHDEYFPDVSIPGTLVETIDNVIDFLPPFLVGPPITPRIEFSVDDVPDLTDDPRIDPDVIAAMLADQTLSPSSGHRLFHTIDP